MFNKSYRMFFKFIAEKIFNSPFELQKLYTLIPGIYVEGIIKIFIFPLINDFPGYTLIAGFMNLSNKFRFKIFLVKIIRIYFNC